jgi:hypothetical protein
MKFNNTIKAFSVLLFFQITSLAVADIIYSNNIVYIKGMLLNDHIEFRKILFEKQVKKVVFENCHGGIAYAGYQIAKEIERKELDTYFKGVVGSSCAIGFMGGKNRYSDKSDFFL